MPRPTTAPDAITPSGRATSRRGPLRSATAASALLVAGGLLAAACSSSSSPAAGGTTHATQSTQAGSHSTTSVTTNSTPPTTPPPTTTTLPSPSTNGQLAVEAKIPLGLPWTQTDAPTSGPPAAEAPNGAVFVASGSVVYVVEGNDTPVAAEHAAGPVVALAADAGNLYVETGLTVTDYDRATGNEVTSWTLPGAGTPTSAGLFAEPGVLWAWNDMSTDESGFNYADVFRIDGKSVSSVSTSANPGDMDADASGLYFVGIGSPAAVDGGHLEKATPAGVVTESSAVVGFGSPIVLFDGTVVVEDAAATGPMVKWETFDPSSLELLTSSESGIQYAKQIAVTGSGLLLAEFPSSPPPTAAITPFSSTGEQLSGGVEFPSNGHWLLEGYYPAVINDQGGQLSLVRLT